MLREEAREALSWIRDPKAAAALEAALAKSTDKREKLGLIAALATQKSTTSVAVLAPFLRDADSELWPSPPWTPCHASAEHRPSPRSRRPRSHPPSQPSLEKALARRRIRRRQNRQPDLSIHRLGPVRLAAFIALVKLAPDNARPALIEAALTSKDDAVRHAALAQGIEIGLPSLQSSLPRTFGQMPAQDRLVVLANIHHLKPAETAAQIALGCVGSTDEDERIVAISSLGKIDTKSAFDALLQAVGAREPRVSQAAATALAASPYQAGPDALIARLKGGSGPDQILAIKALNSLQVPDASALLMEIIAGPDPSASREAMKTLYFIASMDDLRVLAAKASGTTDAEVRKNLVSISSRIATRINTDEARDLVKDLN